MSPLSGKVGHYEGNYLSVQGKKLTPIKAAYRCINSSDGTFMGAVGICEDISNRKKAEEQIIFQSTLLEQVRRQVF